MALWRTRLHRCLWIMKHLAFRFGLKWCRRRVHILAFALFRRHLLLLLLLLLHLLLLLLVLLLGLQKLLGDGKVDVRQWLGLSLLS